MRQPLFILGLAFAATVLIVNVDAIKCYTGVGESSRPIDCTERVEEVERQQGMPRGTLPRATECATVDVTTRQGNKGTGRGCLVFDCDGGEILTDGGPMKVYCTFRCNTDYCNGGSPGGNVPPRGPNAPPPRGRAPVNGAIASNPHIPLLIAVVGSAIAVLSM